METGGKKASSRTKSETVAEPIIAPKNRAKNKKSKKPLIITLIIVGVLLLCGIGFAIWYFAYYNSDNKVLSDAFYNSLSATEGTGEAKITAKVTGNGTTTPDINVEANVKMSYNKDAVALDIDGKLSASIMSIDASANMVVNKNGEVYVKVNDLSGLFSKLGLTSSTLGGFDVNKVSDKWIKISQDDLEDLIPQTEVNTDDYTKCIEKATTALTEDKDVQKELLAAITDSKVLTAKRVGSDKDGIKFRLTGDINAATAFTDKLKEMEVVKALSDCAKDLKGTESIASEATTEIDDIQKSLDQFDTEIYFWVSTWGHQPTRFSLNVKMDEPKMEITLDATRKSGKTEVKMPSDSTSLKSIIEDLQSSYTNPYGGTINYDDLYAY